MCHCTRPGTIVLRTKVYIHHQSEPKDQAQERNCISLALDGCGTWRVHRAQIDPHPHPLRLPLMQFPLFTLPFTRQSALTNSPLRSSARVTRVPGPLYSLVAAVPVLVVAVEALSLLLLLLRHTLAHFTLLQPLLHQSIATHSGADGERRGKFSRRIGDAPHSVLPLPAALAAAAESSLPSPLSLLRPQRNFSRTLFHSHLPLDYPETHSHHFNPCPRRTQEARRARKRHQAKSVSR